MNHQVSSRFPVMVALAALALAAAVAGRRPELVALAAPFVVMVAVASARHRWPQLTLAVRFDRLRAVEGDEVDLVVEISSNVEVPWLDLALELPPSLIACDGSSRAIVSVPAGQTQAVHFPVTLVRWGLASPTQLAVTARDRFGLFASSRLMSLDAAIRVYPSESRLRALVPPRRLGQTLGAHLASQRGDGCEFADVRPYQNGDRLRSVHWRVTARRGELWVSQRHPERSADAVLILDALAEVGTDPDDTTLRRAVRAATALLDGHLGAHDRVGLYTVGGRVRWLRPGLGRAHAYRVVDALLDAQSAVRQLPERVDLAPLRALAPGTLIVALTSLLDHRIADVLVDLAARRYDVVVAESPAEPLVGTPATVAAGLARRLWLLQTGQLRQRLAEVGISTVAWDDDRPLASSIRGLAFRRPSPVGSRR